MSLLKYYFLGIVLCFLFFGCQEKIKDVYYLPNNYEGPVIVYFGEDEGQDKKYDEEGRRIFDFDSSGLLKSKFKYVGGTIDIKLFYKTDTGLKEILPNPPLQPSHDEHTFKYLRSREDVYAEDAATALSDNKYSFEIFIAKNKKRYDNLRNDFFYIPNIDGVDQPSKFSLLYDSTFNKK